MHRILPICAVCNKPVEKMDRREDRKNQTITFTVHCHGEEEHCILDVHGYMTAAHITIARAFEQHHKLNT